MRSNKGILDIGFIIILVLILTSAVIFFNSSIPQEQLVVVVILGISILFLSFIIGGLYFGVIGMTIGVIISLVIFILLMLNPTNFFGWFK